MTYRQLQPTPPIKIVFSIVLALFAVYLFFAGTLFGLILLGIAFKLGLREGVEVDFNGKRYRKIYSIFGISVGTWKNLPEIEYISVFKTKKKMRSRAVTAETSLDFVVYKLNLFHSTNKHIEAYITDDKTDAFNVAKSMATILELEIYDATTD